LTDVRDVTSVDQSGLGDELDVTSVDQSGLGDGLDVTSVAQSDAPNDVEVRDSSPELMSVSSSSVISHNNDKKLTKTSGWMNLEIKRFINNTTSRLRLAMPTTSIYREHHRR